MVSLRNTDPRQGRAGAPARRGPLGLVALLAFLTIVVAGAAAVAGEEPAPSPSPTPKPTPPAPAKLSKPAAARPAAASSAAPAVNSAAPAINKDGAKESKQVGPASKSAPASSPGRAPLKFDDDDLSSRYHGHPPSTDVDEDSEEPGPDAQGGPAAAMPPGSKPAQKPVSSKMPLPKPAPPRPAPPTGDPLKVWHDREANEKFRTEQIEGLRARIAQAQVRLDNLTQRRLALLAPMNFNSVPKPPAGEEIDPKMKPKELLEQLDTGIAAVNAEIDDLKTQLVTIETHFQRESGAR